MKNSVEHRMITIASLGSILEYYDFVIYAMLAKYLKLIFFPVNDDITSTLQYFSVFAIGYIVRPFGGIIAGTIGDRFGRKPSFFFSTLLMTVSTLLIAFLPNYAEMGATATIILILCRLGQGLSLGGELPGAATIVGEFSSQQSRGFRMSFVVASASLGAVIASFALFVLTSFLTESEIIHWGWRLPFMMGGLFGLILCWARKNIIETPLFQAEHIISSHHQPLKELLRHQPASILSGIMLTIFLSSLVISNLYFPYYINQYFHYSEKDIYLAATISLIFSALILPITGQLADRLPKNLLLKITCSSYFILSCCLLQFLSYQHFSLLVAFMLIHQLFIALFSSCYYPIMINFFPTKVRYTGIATCYNIAYALMATLPSFLTILLNQFQTSWLLPFTLSMMAFVSLLGIYWIERIETKWHTLSFTKAVSI